ncbi:MAG: NAD(P)H-dependent oxidoreductase subunit E [Zestosphaera sp.]
MVDEIVSRYGYDRGRLVGMLQEIQKRFLYLPREALERLSARLGIPLSEVLNVATFYHQFRLEPVGKYVVYVCFGTACYLRGSSEVYEAMRKAVGLDGGRTTTSDGAVTVAVSVEKARCFGCCSLAPVVMVMSSDGSERYVHGRLTPSEGRKVVLSYRSKALERMKGHENA